MSIENFRNLLLPVILLLILSPLKFNQHLIALIKAEVVKIECVPGSLSSDQTEAKILLARNSLATPLQIISLKIEKILALQILAEELANSLKEGMVIQIRNPWLDQKPNFKVGDLIQAEVQYVSSSDSIRKPGEDAQWWFYDPEEKTKNRPPRRPFKNVLVILTSFKNKYPLPLIATQRIVFNLAQFDA